VRVLRLDRDIESPYAFASGYEDVVLEFSCRFVSCGRCSKRTVIDVTPAGVHDSERRVACPACGNTLAAEFGVDTAARVLKPWENESATARWGFEPKIIHT
jgi:ribosomal protein S27E